MIDERILDHEGRCRFTCAHELGHMVLHKKVQSVFHESGDLDVFDPPSRCEREVDPARRANRARPKLLVWLPLLLMPLSPFFLSMFANMRTTDPKKEIVLLTYPSH